MNINAQSTSGHDPRPAFPAAWAAVREELQARRTARAAHRQLRRDLAGYTSQADYDDLMAVLDRYDDTEAAEIRHILNEVRSRAA